MATKPMRRINIIGHQNPDTDSICSALAYAWLKNRGSLEGLYEAPEEEKNFTTLLEMINASEAREDDEDFQNPVDLMFERLEEKDPEHFAVKQYKKYKLAAGDICSK